MNGKGKTRTKATANTGTVTRSLVDDVQLRTIAKSLAAKLPTFEDGEYAQYVTDRLGDLRTMDARGKLAARVAYIFSRKVPESERADVFQTLFANVYASMCDHEALAYSIARCDWLNWWRDYKAGKRPASLDAELTDGDGNEVVLSELVVGECELNVADAHQNDWQDGATCALPPVGNIDAYLDARGFYERLPDRIRAIVDARLMGKGTNAADRKALERWIASRPTELAHYATS